MWTCRCEHLCHWSVPSYLMATPVFVPEPSVENSTKRCLEEPAIPSFGRYSTSYESYRIVESMWFPSFMSNLWIWTAHEDLVLLFRYGITYLTEICVAADLTFLWNLVVSFGSLHNNCLIWFWIAEQQVTSLKVHLLAKPAQKADTANKNNLIPLLRARSVL